MAKPKLSVKLWDIAYLYDQENMLASLQNCTQPFHFGVVREGGSIKNESDIEWYIAMYPWLAGDVSIRYNVWRTDEFGNPLPLKQQKSVQLRQTYKIKKEKGERFPVKNLDKETGKSVGKMLPGGFWFDDIEEPSKINVLGISEISLFDACTNGAASRLKTLKAREKQAEEQRSWDETRKRWADRGRRSSPWGSKYPAVSNGFIPEDLANIILGTCWPRTPVVGFETRDLALAEVDRRGIDRDIIDQFISEANGAFSEAYHNSCISNN
jgi:hypothetical protein